MKKINIIFVLVSALKVVNTKYAVIINIAIVIHLSCCFIKKCDTQGILLYLPFV